MTPSQKTMLKKKREQMRKRLRYDIAALIKLSEGELGEFEATHAIVDSILEGLNEKLRYGQIKPTLELGIAQTYLEHTKHQAGQAGDTEPAKMRLKEIQLSSREQAYALAVALMSKADQLWGRD